MKHLLIAIVMVTLPVMGAHGTETPKELQPSLDAKLAAGWHYAEAEGVFVSAAGERFSPLSDLPKGTRIHYMVPHLAKADPAALTGDERNLAQYLQVVFPKGTAVEPFLALVSKWPCVEQVQRSPEISLP